MNGQMVRPTEPSATNFLRKLKTEEKMILLAAGGGCTTRGFNNCLDAFQVLWNLGYRPDADLTEWLGVVQPNEKNGA